MSASNEANFLELSMHGRVIAYLAGYRNGRNVLSFIENFKQDFNRSTYGLITHPSFPKSEEFLSTPRVNNHRLHASLSNLLPEGALREYLAQSLKTHTENEFKIFSYLGDDLPGALVAKPLQLDQIPAQILSEHTSVKVIDFDDDFYDKRARENKFSLAGVQMKFSMKEKDGRYHLLKEGALGDWIVKTPSTHHKDVPFNEYSAMTLASLAGVFVPEIKLVELNKLDNLPSINLPDEKVAFAIRRFDREAGQRIHMEDFAQVFVKYPYQKYGAASYENIGKVLYDFSGDSIADTQRFARQLLVNILLANGDAHLKNWSLLYQDKVTPRLSPAYDILATQVYMDDEKEFALNLDKRKNWYKARFDHFETWASKVGMPWAVVKPVLEATLDKARTLWPEAIKDLPMNEEHKLKLAEHWGRLHSDFRIN